SSLKPETRPFSLSKVEPNVPQTSQVSLRFFYLIFFTPFFLMRVQLQLEFSRKSEHPALSMSGSSAGIVPLDL
ncbi:hypothetical protein, partial [Labilibaculum sp.]|uniref:hypothetical protein n=1 Tax=Labilibaculum sp. TaxID=2060723 RepID=UPI0035675CA2